MSAQVSEEHQSIEASSIKSTKNDVLWLIDLFTGVEQPILFGFAAIKVQLRMPCNFEPNPEDKDTPGSSMGTSVPSWRTLWGKLTRICVTWWGKPRKPPMVSPTARGLKPMIRLPLWIFCVSTVVGASQEQYTNQPDTVGIRTWVASLGSERHPGSQYNY